MIGKDKAYKLIQRLLWTIEDYVQMASTPKRYGTGTLYHRLEIHLVDTVGKREGINVTELARAHGITKSAVSQAVKKLERKGLIERYRMPDNRKEVLFRITTEGRVAFEAHLNFHVQVEGPFIEELASLNEDEARGITKLMDLLDRRAILVRTLERDNQEETNLSES
ncbi:MAG: MarR family transcriptional regulator [Spirochaetaceae bacterium]|nr:MarR family transcriptional regulator [Spirochaetaceae bacterium]